MKLELITNATHCSEDKLSALADAGMHLINFSFDGGTPETYNYIRRHSNYEQVLENIQNLKNKFANQETYFAVNNTVMRSNLDEILETINLWESLDIDMVRIITMIVRYPDVSLIQESLYPINNRVQSILDKVSRHIIENQLRIALCRQYNQQSPIKKEYPNNFIGQWVCSDRADVRKLENCRQLYLWKEHRMMPSYKCSSAFNFARVLPNGDVQLCYKYSIGNLHKSNFEDIWFGEEANRIRKLITTTEEDCNKCDAFRFCIGTEQTDMHKIESHFNYNLHPYLDSIDFQAGTVDVTEPCLPPRLISTQDGYNIVYFEDTFIGVPCELGPIDLDKVNLDSVPGIIFEKTYVKLLSKIHEEIQNPLGASHHGKLLPNYYSSPTTIEAICNYNIVAWKFSFYGIPQFLGELDIDQINLNDYDNILTDVTLNHLKVRIQSINNKPKYSFIKKLINFLKSS